jgi:hypothetical protein
MRDGDEGRMGQSMKKEGGRRRCRDPWLMGVGRGRIGREGRL